MKIKRYIKSIKMPEKSHLPDVGLDIFLPEDVTIESLETITVGLKLGVAIPEGFAGILVPRSSITEKGLIIQSAVIDPDYSGEIHLIATNCSKNTLHFEKNSRVCSLVLMSVLNPYIEEVDILPNTIRNDKGLGSTGK